MDEEQSNNQNLFSEIITLIECEREQIAVSVNASLTGLYWQIGKHISREVLIENLHKAIIIAQDSISIQ